jgi:hypothetical protein
VGLVTAGALILIRPVEAWLRAGVELPHDDEGSWILPEWFRVWQLAGRTMAAK